MRHDGLKLIATCLCAAFLVGTVGRAAAEDESKFKKDMKQAGRDMKSGIVEFGRGMRDTAKDVGHGAKKAGKEVGHTAKDAPKDLAEGIKHGKDSRADKKPAGQ